MGKTSINPDSVDAVLSIGDSMRIMVNGDFVGEVDADGDYQPMTLVEELQDWRLGKSEYDEEDVKHAVLAAADKEGWKFSGGMKAWLES